MSILKNLQLITLFLLMISVSFQSCKTEHNQKLNLAEEKEKLFERVDEFNSAFEVGDTETLEAMITNKYIHTNGSSKAIRQSDWLAYLKKRKRELTNGHLIVDDYEMDEVEIEIYDDMAIVTGKIAFSSIKSDEQKENEIRITNVWVKEDGIWKRAGFHDSRIK